MDEKPTYEELERRIQQFQKSESELKMTEKNLREREEKYRSLIDSSPLPFLITQEEKIVFVNPAVLGLFGVKNENEIIGTSPKSWIHPDFMERAFQRRCQALEKNESLEPVELTLVRKDGHEIAVLANTVCIRHTGMPAILSMFQDITERKQAEKALLESEGLFRGMFKDHSAVMLLIDPDTGQIIKANQAAVQYYGYPLEKMLHMKIQQLNILSPEQVAEQMLSALNKQINTFEFQHMLADGQVRDVEVHSAPITIQNQTLLFSIIRDITDRKQAEEALRESNKTAHQFFSESSAGAFFMMLDEPVEWNDSVNKEKVLDYVFDHQRITKINRAMLDQYLSSEKDFLCMTPKQMFAHDLEHGRLLWRKMFDQGFLDIESDERRFDGSQMWIIGNYRCMFDEQGRIIGHFGTQHDITERKQAEMELRKAQLITDNIPVGLHLYHLEDLSDDRTLRMVYANPVVQALTGIGPEDVVGKTLDENFSGLRAQGIPQRYAEVVRTQTAITLEDITYGDNRGFLASFLIKAFPLPGNMVGIAFENITERKQADADREKLQEQLNQAQKMESVGSLAGGIAHDFNNLLFPILGLSEMMLKDFPPGSPEHKDAQLIFNAGTRGRELVQQILSFSRQSEHQPIPVHIQKILKEVLKLCRATIPADITITKDIQADCGPVMADPTQIHQIAMNLITNAYHAVEPVGGTIAVKLKEVDFIHPDDPAVHLASGRYAVLSVLDTGTGIEPVVMNKIFDPYFTTKEKGRGTGLGLATVYGIVKAHGGDIRVNSEMGKGSSFHVYLPLLEKAQESEPEKKMNPYPTGTEHILVVDDEKAIVQLEKQMLERLGYHNSCFPSSRNALAAFKTDPSRFDLVITDMNMPQMTGIQLAKELVAIRPDIPIILCTGFSERINSKKAKALGIRGLLMKPVGMKDLAQKVREVLDMAPDKN